VEVAPAVTMVRSEAERGGYSINAPGRPDGKTSGRPSVNTPGRPSQRRRASTTTTEELNEQDGLERIFQDAIDLGVFLEYNENFYALSGEKVHVTELYNPGILGEKTTAFNLTPGTAYDLRLGCDLSQLDEQQKVLDDIARENPALVVGSPPCSAFSTLQNLNDTTSEKYQATLADCLNHFGCNMKVYTQR